MENIKSDSFLVKGTRAIGNLLSGLIHNMYLLKGYNYMFERLPDGVIRQLVKFVHLPDRDMTWTIKLLNGKSVKTKIYKDNVKTKQFAVSYKWHSPALNFTELLLSRHAGAQAPWIDIGANLGLRSLLPLSEQRFVYMIEPNNELNVLNRERCELNGFRNFKIMEIGVSDSDGVAEFYVDTSSYNSSLHKTVHTLDTLERKETITLDSIDNLFMSLEHAPACIKIDVEGHELQVLEGGARFISKWHPPLIVEVNEEGGHFLAFRDIMKKLDYSLYHALDAGKGKYYRKIDMLGDETGWIVNANDFLALHKNDAKLRAQVEEYCQ